MNYPLPSNEVTLAWYRTQARFYAPMSLHFLRLAGIKPGMNVLDVGSGAGDVSRILPS